MGRATTRELTRATYHQLMMHACRASDFAFLGSAGYGSGRGTLCGFSAMAVCSQELPGASSAAVDTASLAREMEELAAPFQVERGTDPNHLTGGWIGYLGGYELGYARERRLAQLHDASTVRLMHAGLYLWTASFDRNSGRYWLWIHPECPASIQDQIEQWLSAPPANRQMRWHMEAPPFAPVQTPEEFKSGVEAVKRYIEAGDCYQANLSQAFSGKFCGHPWLAFEKLTEANPTPYSAFLRAGDDRFSPYRQSGF